MCPTSPGDTMRWMCSSCTVPCSTTATRVSCGVTLIRTSWLVDIAGRCIDRSEDRESEPAEQLRGLRERQAHHPRVAAFEPRHEHRRATLDGIAPGLVGGFAGGDVALD